MLEISNTIYYIEHNIHLFWYHGNGIICLSDYIEQQIHKNNIIKQKLVQIVHELTNKIEFHYYSYINSDKLAKKQQGIVYCILFIIFMVYIIYKYIRYILIIDNIYTYYGFYQ